MLAEQTCFSEDIWKATSEKTTRASTFRLNSQVLHFHFHGKENYQFDCGFTYYNNCLIERLPILKMICLDVKVNDRMELLPSNFLNLWNKIIQQLIAS